MLIQSLPSFDAWLERLRDNQARARILIRIRRLSNGNPGDHRGVGNGIMQLRIDYGPGYRVYYVQRKNTIVVLLCGGDKSTQSKDIDRAKTLAADLEDNNS